MPCPETDDMLRFLDGELSESSQHGLEDHVAGCGECRAVVAELGRTLPSASRSHSTSTGAPAQWQASSGGDVVTPGARIGRYLVLEEIGAGAMGVVYRAYDPELERNVALKLVRVLDSDAAGAERSRARLVREAKAMARVAQPNVVAIHDASAYGAHVFVAMELVDGVDLAAWLRQARRPPHEVVAVFLDAARGLAAAHAAGVIHRDFKPQNVLVGKDGRARVTDFGLAALADDESGAAGGPDADPATPATVAAVATDADASAATEDSQRLTRTGTSLGTPAYMSPEAERRGRLDERSDQYSYAVALAEALFGRRPVAGRLPAGGTVPSPLRRIVKQALSPRPEDRFPSMTQLIAALSRAQRSRRRQLAAAAVALAVIAVVAGSVGYAATRPAPIPPCGGADAALATAWDSPGRAAIEAAFARSGLPYAGDVLATVEHNLDDFAATWRQGYRDACEATEIRHVQSEAILDLRMQCLRDELVGFDSAIDLLADATPPIIGRSVGISNRADRLGRCSDVAALTREVPRPGGPAAQTEIDRIARAYDDTLALEVKGDMVAALARLDELTRAAHAVGYDRMEAEITGRLGETQWRTGDLGTAEQTLYRALALAWQARSDDISSGLLSVLVAVVGYEQGRHEEGLMLARIAEIQTLAIGDRGRLANLLGNRGALYHAQKDLVHAEADWRRALEIGEEVYGPRDPRVGQAHNNMAVVFTDTNRSSEAIAAYDRALDIYQSALGAQHPQVALTLANRSIVYNTVGRRGDAAHDLERAIAIRTEVFGPDYPALVMNLRDLGTNLIEDGHAADGIPFFERALAICERAHNTTTGGCDEAVPALADARNAAAEQQKHPGKHPPPPLADTQPKRSPP